MTFCVICRAFEDYAVLYCGPNLFKVTCLLYIAGMSVHFFACIFYRVKQESADSPADVTYFYTSRDVDPNVRARGKGRGCLSSRALVRPSCAV